MVQAVSIESILQETTKRIDITSCITSYANSQLSTTRGVYDLFNMPTSLRLKPLGANCLCKLFKHYTVTARLTSGELIKMGNFLTSPYYASHSKLTLFGSEYIFFLKLAQSDAHAWISTFS